MKIQVKIEETEARVEVNKALKELKMESHMQNPKCEGSVMISDDYIYCGNCGVEIGYNHCDGDED